MVTLIYRMATAAVFDELLRAPKRHGKSDGDETEAKLNARYGPVLGDVEAHADTRCTVEGFFDEVSHAGCLFPAWWQGPANIAKRTSIGSDFAGNPDPRKGGEGLWKGWRWCPTKSDSTTPADDNEWMPTTPITGFCMPAPETYADIENTIHFYTGKHIGAQTRICSVCYSLLHDTPPSPPADM